MFICAVGISTGNTRAETASLDCSILVKGQIHPAPLVRGGLTKPEGGKPTVKRIPNLSLEQIYPPAHDDTNLNTCHDPDCGNFGEAADLGLARPRGQGVKLKLAAMRSNTAIVGLGRYKMSSNSGDSNRRVSSALEYTNDPHSWIDARQL